jgi:hypothetical protein
MVLCQLSLIIHARGEKAAVLRLEFLRLIKYRLQLMDRQTKEVKVMLKDKYSVLSLFCFL